MRVLHVIPSLSTRRGGPSAAARAIAAGLAAAGAEVHIAATDDDGDGRAAVPLGAPLREGGATCWYFPRQSRRYTASLPLAAWLARRVAGFDVVHAHALFSFAPLAAAAAARARGVPYIVRPLGTLSPYGLGRRRLAKAAALRLLDGPALRGAAAVHFTSEQERREADALGLAGRAAVLPLPVEPPAGDAALLAATFRARHARLDGRAVALFLGRLDPKKGLGLLLPALAAARAGGASLSLVVAGAGEPAYEAGLRALAGGLGLDEAAVAWPGFLAGAEKAAALAGADLFALPSRAENFALAAAEAMAAGLPLLLSDQVGIHDEAAAAGAALVAPRAVEPLAAALALLASDPARRAAMGAAGRRLAAERYAPAAVAASLLALYRRVARPAAADVFVEPGP